MEKWIEGEDAEVMVQSAAKASFSQDRGAKGWMSSMTYLQVLGD